MTRISADHPAVQNASSWLRSHLGISPQSSISTHFNVYFNCEIEYGVSNDLFHHTVSIMFDDEAEAMMFILKWS